MCCKVGSRFVFLVGCLWAFGGFIERAEATDYDWIGGTGGLWNDDGNWNPEGVPSSGDTAEVNAGSALIVDGDFVSINDAFVGRQGTGEVDLTGGEWDLDSTLILGFQGTGVFNMSGGSGSADATYLGYYDHDVGVMNLSAGTWTTNGLAIGLGSFRPGTSGTLTITGGEFHDTGDAYVGNNQGNQGTLKISDGAFDVDGSLAVGYAGTGTMTMTGGEMTAGSLSVGGVNGNASTGTIMLSDGTMTVGDFILGNGLVSNGDMTITGGLFVNNNSATLGNQNGGEGTLSISGGTWQTVDGVRVGFFGAGTVNLTDSGTIQVGDGTGEMDLSAGFGDGTLNIGTGGVAGTLLAGSISGGSGDAEIYFNHTGTVDFAPLLFDSLVVNQQAGTTILSGYGSDISFNGVINVNSGTLVVGEGGLINVANVNVNGSDGTFRVDGGATAGIGELDVINGRVEIDGGSTLQTSAATIGDGGTGTASLIDGFWTNDGEVDVGRSGTGTVNLASTFSADTLALGYGVGDQATLSITDGVSTVNTFNIGRQGTGSFALSGGELDAQDTGIGSFNGGLGIATVSGGTWTSPSSFYVGFGGTGSLIMTDGYISSSDFRIGAAGSGTVTISGGELDADDLDVGTSGRGTLFINGGYVHHSDQAFIGNGPSALVAMMAGTWNAEQGINVDANGTVRLQGGEIDTGGLFISNAGRTEISGGTFNAEQMSIGYTGSSALVITGGVLNNNIDGGSYAGISEIAGGTATVDISGGQWLVPDSELSIGDYGTGIVRLTDSGTIQVGDGSGLAIVGQFGNGELDFGYGGTAGTLLAGEVTGRNVGVVNFDETNTGTFGARLTGNLSVNQIGSGTTVLTAEASHNGATTISAGAIELTDGGWIDGDITNNSEIIFNRADDVTYGSVLSGSGTVIQAGAGTLTFNRDNPATGTTEIQNGTLQIGDGGDTGSPGSGPVVNNSALVFNRFDTFEFANAISGSGGVTQIGSGTVMLTANNTSTGTITISNGGLMVGNGGTSGWLGSGGVQDDATLVFNRGDGITVGNVIASAGQVVQAGAGNLTLTGTNTYSGGTVVIDGTLNILKDVNLGDASGTLTIDGGTVHNTTDLVTSRSVVLGDNGGTFALGSGYFTFLTAFSGNGGLTKTGGNYLTLTGDQTYLGATDIEGGFFKVDGGSLQSSSVSLGAGSIFYFVGGASASSYAGNISGAGKLETDGTKILTGDASQTGGTVIDSGTLQIGDGGTLGSLSGSVADSGNLAFDRSDDTAFSGTISGAGSVSQVGFGVLSLSGSNSYSGGTVINDGLVNFTDASNFGTGQITLNGGGLQWATGHTTDISSRLNPLGVGGGVFDTNGNDVTLASSLSGDGVLAKTGDGVLTLSGSNSYGGGTIIEGGTVAISADDNLGSGDVDLENGVLETTASFASGRGVAFNGGAISVDASQVTTLTGTLIGSVGVTKEGDGTLDISGATNQAADTSFVSGGTLVVSAGNGFGGSVSLANDSTVAFLESTDGTFSGDVSGDGSLAKGGTGTLTLDNGGSSYSGETIINGGAIAISFPSNLGSGDLQIVSGNLVTTESLSLDNDITVGSGSVSPDVGTTLTLNGAISGSDFYKEGAGTVVLAGTNSPSTVHLGEGVLSVSAPGNLGSGGLSMEGGDLEFTQPMTLSQAIALSSGRFVVDAGQLAALNGLISGTGDLVLDGGGILSLANSGNSFTGDVIVDSGTLAVSTDQRLGDGNTVVLNSGGSLQASSTFTSARSFVFNGGGFNVAGLPSTLTGTLTGTGGFVKQGAGSLDVSGATFEVGGTHSITGGKLIVSVAAGFQGDVNDNGTLDFLETTDGTYADQVFGSGILMKDGTATLTLSGTTNSYTGDTVIRSGAVSISSAANLGSGGLQILGGGLQTTQSLSLDANVIMNSGYVSSAVGTTLTLNGAISGGQFIKRGDGTVVLTGSNSQSSTSISQGVLSISSAANLGTGALTLGGGELEFTQSLTLGQTIALAGGGDFLVDAGQTATLNGDLTNAGGGFTKTGDGKLILGSTNNSYNGDTIVNTGILSVSSDANLGGGSNVVLAGGTLETTQSLTTNRNIYTSGGGFMVDAGQTTTVAGFIDGSDLSVGGSGTLEFTNGNVYTGTTTVRGGTLIAANHNALGTSAVSVQTGGTLLVDVAFGVSNEISLAGGSYNRALDAGSDLTHAVDAASGFSRPTTASILQGTLTDASTLVTKFQADSPASNDSIRVSDVYSFEGTGTDTWVLQLSVASLTERSQIDYLDSDGSWVNAVLGNTGTNTPMYVEGAYDSSTDFTLGYYGFDAATGSAWAVLNHNSDYAIVSAPTPEPSTWALLLGGGLVVAVWRRRSRLSR